MNYNEMKTFVRTHADTDTTDASDTILDVYAKAAYNDIRRRLGVWDEYHGSDTLTTTASTVSYALDGSGFASQNLEMVTSVVGGTSVLTFIPWDIYLEMRSGTDSTHSTAEADWYTVKDGSVYLYPDPSNSTETYTVYGFTTWTDWPAVGGDAPLPDEFDEPICWYMLAKYYQSQEDLELAQIMMADYERGVERMLTYAQRKDAHRPRIFGGRRNRRSGMSYDAWMRRNTEG